MTAVEWLVEQFETIVFYSEEAKEDTINQAKEMEKQQIIDAFESGKEKMEEFQNEIPDEDETIYLMYGSEYYNNNFKSE